MILSGGYKSLPFFKQSEIIYDFTVEFTKRYIDPKSRTKDQMEQAARNSKQNIAEGYLQRSMEGRLKLLGVSRGSLEELLNDYQDFLRQKKLFQWEVQLPQARKVRALAYKVYKSYNDYNYYISSPESAANCMICLINQTNRLIDQKLRWLREEFIAIQAKTANFRSRMSVNHILATKTTAFTPLQFIKKGGFRENLFKERFEFRRKTGL